MDITEKIKMARKAGYSDQQIETFLQSKGMDSSFVKEIPKSKFAIPTVKSVVDSAKDVAIGAGKEIADSAIETSKILQKAGQGAIAAIDPTRAFSEVQQQTGFDSLQGVKAAEIDEQLKADNPEQMVGKGIGFLASVLYPVGKTEEVISVANKGKQFIGASVEGLSEKVSQIGDDAFEGGVGVKEKLIELTSKLDDKTKTALQRTPKEKFDEFVEIGQKAVVDDRAVTPIERVGQNFVEAAQSVKNRLGQIGKQKSVVLNQAKNARQDVSDLVKKAVLDIRKGATNLGDDDAKFANEIIERLMPFTKSGRLVDVDSLIDDIQDGLYKLSDSEKAVQLTDRVTGLIRRSVEGMNKELQKRVGGSYADLNKQYSEMFNLLTDINKGVGRRGERAGAFMKRFFSPSDAGTKRLFEEMQKLTNIDFARDARLAKFVMEALGDRRVESLLEQIPRNFPQSSVDALLRLGSFVGEKMGITDPIKAAEQFIKRNGKL